ncbi:MAG: hypothetical protein D4R90_05225 [Nitrosopumilales archaeon]|nr:MAG: hypothetical protein D4R90_05225 [Nitrosopumilales archaeon]
MVRPNALAEKISHQNKIPPVTSCICKYFTKPMDKAREPKILEPYQNFQNWKPENCRNIMPKTEYKINKIVKFVEISKVNKITNTVKQFRRIVGLLTKCGSLVIPNQIVTPASIISAITGSKRGTP